VRVRQQLRHALHHARDSCRGLRQVPPVLHRQQKLMDTAGGWSVSARIRDREGRRLTRGGPDSARRSRGGGVARELADPETARNPAKLRQLGREHARLDQLRQAHERLDRLEGELAQARAGQARQLRIPVLGTSRAWASSPSSRSSRSLRLAELVEPCVLAAQLPQLSRVPRGLGSASSRATSSARASACGVGPPRVSLRPSRPVFLAETSTRPAVSMSFCCRCSTGGTWRRPRHESRHGWSA